MAPTMEKRLRRLFHLRLESETVKVFAETICEPTKGNPTYTLKRDGEVVGKFSKDAVIGWWVED